MFDTVQNNLLSCDCGFMTFTVAVVLIILCAILIFLIVNPSKRKLFLYLELPKILIGDDE